MIKMCLFCCLVHFKSDLNGFNQDPDLQMVKQANFLIAGLALYLDFSVLCLWDNKLNYYQNVFFFNLALTKSSCGYTSQCLINIAVLLQLFVFQTRKLSRTTSPPSQTAKRVMYQNCYRTLSVFGSDTIVTAFQVHNRLPTN